jgi:hypothetical protein
MKITITFLLVFTNLLSAQIKGVVVDENNIPIPYVNIWMENENIGTTSEENGSFQLNVSKDKNLIFSAIGYKKSTTFFKEKIVLEKEFYKLDEVIIVNLKLTKELEIGDSKKINHSYLSGELPWIYAKYFPYKEEYSETPFLKKIIVFTKSKINKAKFKIHLYTMGEDGNPNSDILSEDILVSVKSGLKENQIDLSKHKIKIPKEGICIGYEWMIIEDNKYEFEYKDVDKSKHTYKTYSPNVICNDVEVENTYHYSGGKWKKRSFYFNDKLQKKVVIEPAINLILTN